MITVEFSNCHEVRMGSPYKTCELLLSGEWVPKLELGGWLAIQTRSSDERYLALARWDTAANMPGFRVALIDQKEKIPKNTWLLRVSRVARKCRRLEGVS